MDKITNDAKVYSDVQNLEQLRGALKTKPNAVKHEVAQQFESMFISMVLHSMREANKAFESDLLPGSDMSMYQDMFDKQISLSMAGRGLGFAEVIERNISQQLGETPTTFPGITPPTTLPVSGTKPHSVPLAEKPVQTAATIAAPAAPTSFNSPGEFVKSMWTHAKQAGRVIGVQPTVLIAQAALETDWGRKVIPHQDRSSHNLFNIKSDASGDKPSTSAVTLEQRAGVLTKEKANFRSYGSFQESFLDYASMIKNNPRYKKAVENASEPAAYTQALQEAGYATDHHYARKIMDIVHSPWLQSVVAELK